ncbi:MAG: glycosyltransferase family 4 protein [Desulfobacterales bacterium]
MMRLCLIIYGSLDTLTGGFLYDKFLVEHLRQQGHEIDIVSLPWRRYGQHLLDNFSAKLRSRLTKKSYDLILQDELNHPSLFWLNHRLHNTNDDGTPLVSIVHQVLSGQPRRHLLNRLYRVVEKAYLTSIDAFIFNSKTTRSKVQRLINFTRPSIVAPPGGDRLGYLADAGQLKARAGQAGPLKMVCVGNVTPIKGLSRLIETLAMLPPEIWQLKVVGSLTMDPGHARKVKRLISAKNIGRQVVLAGPLNGRELINILSGSQLFVMPFSNEGFGIACLEALAYGLPVLASTTGAVKEFIRHGDNGFLYAAGQTRAVAKTILDLHKDRDCLLKISETALQSAMSRPGWDETMESVDQFLRNLVKQRRK